MPDYTKLQKDTILLHAGQENIDSSMSRAVPIYQLHHICLKIPNMPPDYSGWKSSVIYIPVL